MAALVSCKITSTSGTAQAGPTAQIDVNYNVNVDGPAPPQEVIELAQAASGTNDPVGVIGAPWGVEIGGSVFADALTQLDQITARQRIPGAEGALKWMLTSTYKNPNLRNLTQARDAIHPLNRIAEVWTESSTITERRDIGINEKPINWPWLDDNGRPAKRPANTRGPITNAAGFRYGIDEPLQWKLPVFVLRTFTLNPFAWISVYNDYANTVNSDQWDVFGTGKTVSPGTCRFLDISSSHPRRWGSGIIYYEIETRVLYNKFGHDLQVRNEGDKVWRKREVEGEGTKWEIHVPTGAGVPLQPPLPMTINGELRTENSQDEFIVFRDLERRSFVGLNAAIGGA